MRGQRWRCEYSAVRLFSAWCARLLPRAFVLSSVSFDDFGIEESNSVFFTFLLSGARYTVWPHLVDDFIQTNIQSPKFDAFTASSGLLPAVVCHPLIAPLPLPLPPAQNKMIRFSKFTQIYCNVQVGCFIIVLCVLMLSLLLWWGAVGNVAL